MTAVTEPAEAILTITRSSPDPKTYTERSKLTEVPISTLWHREHGRLSRKDAAAKWQYLTPSEEKTVVEYIRREAEGDHPVLVKGATIKRQLVTTIECISAAGEYLSPLVIWPAHYAWSPKGYSNTTIILNWYRQVFDPETKKCANGRPRILINDGFGPHECLEVQQYCRDNNIILCQLPSHTSHKLQPCDVSIFGPLKTAYRDLVEDMCRKGVKAVGKQHFTLLYDRARRAALTPSNIKSAWAKVGIYPFNPDRVLRYIPKPPNPESQSSQTIDTAQYDELLRTPVNSEQFASLRKTIEQNMPTLDEHNQQCLQKMVHAAEKFVSARDLLHQECSDKFQQANESAARASIRSIVVGKGKIMSFEDIEEARAKREKKEVAQARRRGRKGKSLASARAPRRGKQTRTGELEGADCEIDATELRSYCSVFRV